MTKRYEIYKDSGVQWLGEIPNHWESKKVKYLTTINDESLSNNEDPDRLIEYVEIGDVNFSHGIFNVTKYRFEDAPSRARRVTKTDDIIISTVRTYLKAISRIERDGLIVSTGFAVLRPKYVDSSYLSYATSTEYFVGKVLSESVGISYPAINNSKLVDIKLPLPPLSEQRSIVTYLDDKCAKIDKSIENMEKQIALLQEMKQRVIADAVTRGVDKTVKFKKTNIAWLPEVPEHWEISNLRKFLKIFSEKGHGDKQLLSVTREQGVIVRDVESKEENHNFIPEDLSGYKFVQRGDFVINKMKSWQGSYGVSLYDGIVSPAYYTCKLDGVDADFFSVAIRSKSYVPFFGQYSKGIRVNQWDLSPISLKTIPFMLPPIEEQRTIVSYINERTTKIETLAKKIEQEIVYLKEYKQRLISDVVTGQVKVC